MVVWEIHLLYPMHHHLHVSSHLTHPNLSYMAISSFIHKKLPAPNTCCVSVYYLTTFLIPFSLHMPLIITFSSVGDGFMGRFGRRNLLEKFCYDACSVIACFVILDIRITWVQVSRLPVLHPDRD